MTGSTKQSRPYLLGIAGGSGSGKTYFSHALRNLIGPQYCELVLQDHFYIDQSDRFDFDGGSVNFDHPDSIDALHLAQCLMQLKGGQSTQIPIYDFVSHKRLTQTSPANPKSIILVDGIMLFHWSFVREIFDEMIFFDANESLRFQRRLERDVKERGRTQEGVRAQFFGQVKPMHDQFVEPSKKFAHRIVEDSGNFSELLEEQVQKLKLIIS